MRGIGWQEIILVALVLFIFFGAKNLPETGQALGKAIKEFRKALTGAGGASESAASAVTEQKKG